MLMIYGGGVTTKHLPFGVPCYQYTNRRAAKERIRDEYAAAGNANKESIDIAIYDTTIRDENDVDNTLVDIIRSFVDFDVVNLYIFRPLKIYEMNSATLNVVLPFSASLASLAESYSGKAKTHIIDDIMYFFVGHEYGEGR